MPSAVPTSTPTPTTTNAGLQRAMAWIQAGPKRLLIGGEWVEAKSGKTFETINPANEQLLTSVAEADSADIDAAVRAARRAFEAPSWAGVSPQVRSRLLFKIADLVDKHAEELAALESLDNGSPLSSSTARVGQAAEIFRDHGG